VQGKKSQRLRGVVHIKRKRKIVRWLKDKKRKWKVNLKQTNKTITQRIEKKKAKICVQKNEQIRSTKVAHVSFFKKKIGNLRLILSLFFIHLNFSTLKTTLLISLLLSTSYVFFIFLLMSLTRYSVFGLGVVPNWSFPRFELCVTIIGVRTSNLSIILRLFHNP